MTFSDDRKIVSAVIPAAGSLSAPVSLGGLAVVGAIIPATGSGDFDASTVNLLFLVAADGTNYDFLRDKDATLEYITVAANNTNGRVPLDPIKWAAWGSVKVETYQTDKATPQTQTAETTIQLVVAKITGA